MSTTRENGFIFLLALLLATGAARGHDPILDLPEPKTVPEAWNVITQSVENVGKLLETNQLREVALHVANCSPAIRTLQANLPADDEAGRQRRGELEAMYAAGGAVIEATRQRDRPREAAIERYEALQRTWRQIRRHYPAEVVNAAVYVCPMHPLDRHLDKDAECTACGMRLIRRRIPPSPVYEKPGAPSMKLDVATDRPLTVGRRTEVKVRLSRLDGTPVREEDLVVMHTQRIHLLIIDRSLLDYHHEHPMPTSVPGEFQFAIIPRKPGPYRIFADVVPAETSMQEYVVADIPSKQSGLPIGDRAARNEDVVDGLRFVLEFETKGRPIRVGEEVKGRVTVTDARGGQPFRALEPVMGAYAHLVGFADDQKTVVHLHPLGGEPKTDAERGGPTLNFRFYPPVAGFVRFYAQVQVGGEQKFARFGVNVLPGEAETKPPPR